MAQETTGTILDYVETQFETFDERPLGDVDSLVLSWFTYWRFDKDVSAVQTRAGMPLIELYRNQVIQEKTAEMLDEITCRHMFAALVASRRFGDMRVANYIDEVSPDDEKQFAAMTFLLPGGGTYVAFRGTDGTMTGWKEDFNMAFDAEVPSQRAAAKYLNYVASCTTGPIWVGGHSKGGNLAVYAVVHADEVTSPRVRAAFSHDGPGFTEETLSSATWQAAAHLIHKTLPKESIIGMLFERQEDYAVVASTASGFLQHDPFSWVVEGTQFKLEEEISKGARHVDSTLNTWISSMTPEEREGITDTMFDIFDASGYSSFIDMSANWQTSVPAMFAYVRKLEPERRKYIEKTLRILIRAIVGEVPLPSLPLS